MERDVAPPSLVQLSASRHYGRDLTDARAAELATELSGLLAAVHPFLLTTDFDSSIDGFLGALKDVARSP